MKCVGIQYPAASEYAASPSDSCSSILNLPGASKCYSTTIHHLVRSQDILCCIFRQLRPRLSSHLCHMNIGLRRSRRLRSLRLILHYYLNRALACHNVTLPYNIDLLSLLQQLGL